MGIAKKGKRKILYQGKEYLWWVREDEDCLDAPWLTIASPDRSLVLSYRVEGGDFFVVSKGKIFQGEETSGKWEYYWYPFEKRTPPLVITPGFVRELIAWAVDGRGAELISGKRNVLRVLYLLVLCDEELSYDNYREEFCIGIFSSREKAEMVAKYYLENVEGFKDYPCSYRIEEKNVLGEGNCDGEKIDGKVICGKHNKNDRSNKSDKNNKGDKNDKSETGGKSDTVSNEIYMAYGWNENSEGDEVYIVESDCFITELAAKQGMAMMKQMYARTEWCISRFRVDERTWEEGFVRV